MHPASAAAAASTRDSAKRSIFDNLQSPGFSVDAPQLPGFEGGEYRLGAWTW
jgi:hypothetical protein